MRRLTLFAGYNYGGVVSDYVVEYIKELAKYSEILYLADGKIDAVELKKIRKYCKSITVLNHKSYDFGSYSSLFTSLLDKDGIDEYDEIILANDSCICVNSFDSVFEFFDQRPELDAWALLSSDDANTYEVFSFSDYWRRPTVSCSFNLCTFFLALRKNILKDPKVRSFLMTCNEFSDREKVCNYYEKPFTQLLHNRGYKVETYVPNIYRFSSSYGIEAFNLIKKGFPLLKVRLFTDNIGCCPFVDDLLEVSEKFCDFDVKSKIKKIRSERNIKSQDKTDKLSKGKLKKYAFFFSPPIVWETLKLWRNFLDQRNGLKNKFKSFCPPAAFFFKNSIKYLTTHNNKKNKFRLVFKPVDNFRGYYPDQIHNYCQNEKEKALRYANSEELMIFFNVVRDQISGGMLSIDRFSTKIKESFPEITVLQSGLPLNNAVINNSYFDYGTDIVDFHYLVKYTSPKKIQINLPECFSSTFLQELDGESLKWLWGVQDFRINILNQSDILMPPASIIENLRTLCNGRLTITAAHKRYCTEGKAHQYRTPIFLLTPFLPDFYYTNLKDKAKIILYSPDHTSLRDKILKKIKQDLPDFQLVEINNLTIEQYKHKISGAMFVISFGEGYDGYFIEPLLSGTLSFTARNPVFFPNEFRELPNVYKNYEEMHERITDDIRSLVANERQYLDYVANAKNEVRRFTNDEVAWENLFEFIKRFKADMPTY